MTDDEEPMSLQDLVLARLRDLGTEGKPMSARRAAERSRGGVSYDTLYSIARGEHSGRLNDRTVQGIADALDVTPGDVYDAAGLPRPQSRWLWPERFDRLEPPQRRLIEDLAAALLEADRRGYERARRDDWGSGTRSARESS